ncbi:MAG: class IV adenylate cyclase [Candidatus Nezhaarchaeales archaeon]
MIEVEAKVPVSEREKQLILEKLRRINSMEKAYEEEDLFFISINDPSFGNNKTLKLRKSNGRTKLIFKTKRAGDGFKENLEIEVEVKEKDTGNLVQLLNLLGFKESLVIRKRRLSFCFDHYTINVDDVEGLGSFVEIEILTDESEVERARNEISKILSVLGISEKEIILKSYAEMMVNR